MMRYCSIVENWVPKVRTKEPRLESIPANSVLIPSISRSFFYLNGNQKEFFGIVGKSPAIKFASPRTNRGCSTIAPYRFENAVIQAAC